MVCPTGSPRDEGGRRPEESHRAQPARYSIDTATPFYANTHKVKKCVCVCLHIFTCLDSPSFFSALPEFNNSLPELLCSDEDSGNEEVLDMEYSEAETEDLKRNAEVRSRPPTFLPHTNLHQVSVIYQLHTFHKIPRICVATNDWDFSNCRMQHIRVFSLI